MPNLYQHVATGTNASTWNMSAEAAEAKYLAEGGRIFGPYSELIVVAEQPDDPTDLAERPA